MIQPDDLKILRSVRIANNEISDTEKLWAVLSASLKGNLELIKKLLEESPNLAYAQYNYTPPIHFAVREGHTQLVEFLLSLGAWDVSYKTYPFQISLPEMVGDRDYDEILDLLNAYAKIPSRQKFKGDNGEIDYQRTEFEKDFEAAVDSQDLASVKSFLEKDSSLVKNNSFFWGEGIMMMPAKDGNIEMLELLLRFGATVPGILKWAQFYYFERYDSAAFLMRNGMSPHVMSWHHVSLLHDIAQKGDIKKAELLLDHGADINAIDEEFQSTPLGLAARWGQTEMVSFLLKRGADPSAAGASWSSPITWAREKGHQDIEQLLTKGSHEK